MTRKLAEAVETLLERIKKQNRPLALLAHMGEVWVADPKTITYSLLVKREPAALVGVYDASATRSQVVEDLK